jgi:hypothetical protein
MTMKALKSIAILGLVVASSLAQAQRDFPVEQYGRGAKPAAIEGTIVNVNAAANVNAVHTGAAYVPVTAANGKAALMVTQRSVNVYGRS